MNNFSKLRTAELKNLVYLSYDFFLPCITTAKKIIFSPTFIFNYTCFAAEKLLAFVYTEINVSALFPYILLDFRGIQLMPTNKLITQYPRYDCRNGIRYSGELI